MKSLVFAPLVRVSGVKQAKKGESLRTQRKQLNEIIEQMGGMAPEYYEGQEHSTPDEERKILDCLLKDAKAGKFDAVIVADADRWARDNLKSEEGLRILKDNGIRFFVSNTEYNLFDPTQTFMLKNAVLVGEFQAMLSNKKAMQNRIERCKRGIPANPCLPYGRTFDRKAEKWGIDGIRKDAVNRAVKRYLDGDRTEDIGKSMPPYLDDDPRGCCKRYGMSKVSITKILREQLGNKWTIRFKSKRLNIDESIEMVVPPLIDDPALIQKVRDKLWFKTKFKQRRGKYLLQGSAIIQGILSIQLKMLTNKYYNKYVAFKGLKCILNKCTIDNFH